jgi:OOP family OmpA-OmpF porin
MHGRPAPKFAATSCHTAVILLLMSCAASARADDTWFPDWYVGLDGGQAKSPVDARGMSHDVLVPGTETGQLVRYEAKAGGDIFVGRRFSPTTAVEVGLFDFAPFGYTADTLANGQLTGHIRVRGIYADFVGRLPIWQGLSAIGRVGAHVADVHDTFDMADTSVLARSSANNTSFNYDAGLGLQYDFTKNIGLRVQAQRYRVDKGVGRDVNIGYYTVGLVVGLGSPPPAPAIVTPAPTPAPAPAPAPTPAPAPAPAPAVIHTLSADSLFAFDKALLTPVARTSLDDLAHDTAGQDVESISITGYADRIGKPDYNLQLSQRRADAVKTYLATRPELAHTPMEAIGKGETNPVTAPDACVGKMSMAARVKCLQPDRRVDVEVRATPKAP